LNFSNATPEQIREGIRRLSAAVERHLTAAMFLPGLPVGV
jgi:DNA-binding transcriptional MocR family regulator